MAQHCLGAKEDVGTEAAKRNLMQANTLKNALNA